jgi:hypothetical protein
MWFAASADETDARCVTVNSATDDVTDAYSQGLLVLPTLGLYSVRHVRRDPHLAAD